MKELSYPFDAEYIIKKKKSLKTKIPAFYNEPIYVAELGRDLLIKQHDQSAAPDSNTMLGSDC